MIKTILPLVLLSLSFISQVEPALAQNRPNIFTKTYCVDLENYRESKLQQLNYSKRLLERMNNYTTIVLAKIIKLRNEGKYKEAKVALNYYNQVIRVVTVRQLITHNKIKDELAWGRVSYKNRCR